MILDDSSTSLECTLKLFEKFRECAGLKANIDKTEAIWIGAKKGCRDKLLPEKNLAWNFSGKFKTLGICFDLSKKDKTLGNFTDKVNQKNILNN